jgi:hypothetical protein
MEIFSEPVICSDGFTYEKSAIEIWFKSNNTSPMTGLVLENKNLIPNRIVKNLLSEIKEEKQEYIINKFYNNIKYDIDIIIDLSTNYFIN